MCITLSLWNWLRNPPYIQYIYIYYVFIWYTILFIYILSLWISHICNWEKSPPLDIPERQVVEKGIVPAEVPGCISASETVWINWSSVQNPGWLMYSLYIGDYNNPRTGNPYKPTSIMEWYMYTFGHQSHRCGRPKMATTVETKCRFQPANLLDFSHIWIFLVKAWTGQSGQELE